MKITRRTSLIILLLSLIFFLGILFRSFLLDNLVRPVALTFWVIWRVVQTVNQDVYWSLLIIAALFFILLKISQHSDPIERPLPSDSNVTLENVNYWRTSILVTNDEIDELNVMKRNLGKMVATIYAVHEPGTANAKIYDALKLHQIPLPENIHAFLFPAMPTGSRQTLMQVLRAIWQAPRKWVRRWTGQEVAEYYQSIQDVLNFMESTMEIKHDD